MIRPISSFEVSLTIECAKAFFIESKLAGKLDVNHWVETWVGLINKGIGVIFSATIKEEIVGILGGFYFPCTMTAEKEALEAFWYVKPEYRGTSIGIKLLQAFEKEGIECGCKRIKMVHLIAINPEGMASIYKRLGYEELQRTYVKELQ